MARELVRGNAPPIRRALVIVNPAARRGNSAARSAARAFAALGIACDVVVTQRSGHAGEVAVANSGDYDAIFALGGDGTAVEVIGALAPDGPPVGVLPGGTGNLLARALGIPMGLERAVRMLVGGDEVRFDLGRLSDGTRFAIGAGVGIDASMIAGTSQRWKRRAGVLAYVVAGLTHVIRRRRFTARVTVDGSTVVRQAAAVLVVNFGVLLSGLVTLGDGIRHDDGKLDVCIFDPATVIDAARIARKLVFRNFSADPAMTYLQGTHIQVETDPSHPVQADGELVGRTPFVVTAEPLAARLLVPRVK